jgi:hypothetical protein
MRLLYLFMFTVTSSFFLEYVNCYIQLAYAIRIDLLSNAKVVNRTVHFIKRKRDRSLIPQNSEVRIDNTAWSK